MGFRASRWTLGGLLVALAVVFAAPAPAQTPGIATVIFPGFEATVSCMSAKICELGGHFSSGGADLVALRNGHAGHPYRVPGAIVVYSVSCPDASGCYALSRPSDDVGAVLTRVNGAGVPMWTHRLSLPTGVTLGRIACAAPNRCEMAGLDVFARPTQVELASWNGSSLALRSVATPKPYAGASDTEIDCVGATCELVGYLSAPSGEAGFVITTDRGVPVRTRLDRGEQFYGVGCTSARTCYATADDTGANGSIVALNGGAIGKATAVTGSVQGIACSGTYCIAGGQLPSTADSLATLVRFSAGAEVGQGATNLLDTYVAVGAAGGTFAAVSPSNVFRRTVVALTGE
jgi:hypothetical protein